MRQPNTSQDTQKEEHNCIEPTSFSKEGVSDLKDKFKGNEQASVPL